MFPSFPLEFSSDFFNLLLARFHQAEIIIVKHLIQGRNNETRLGGEPSTLRSWSRKNDAPNHYATLPTITAATIKNKDRKKDFHDAGLPSPPDSVITRWATWLRAALYYSENLPAVRTIVNNWTSAGLLARVETKT